MLLLLPLLSLSALWGFVLNITVGDGTALLRANTLYETVGVASTELGTELQAERAQSATAITSRLITSGFGRQRDRTDQAITRFREALAEHRAGSSPELRSALEETERRLGGLGAVRAGIDQGRSTRLAVLTGYNHILDAVFLLYDQLVAVPDLMIFQQATAMQAMGNAREMMARENALVNGALIDLRLSPEERAAFADYAANRAFLHDRALSALDSTLGGPYREALNSPAFARFTAMENAIASGTGDRLPAEAAQWREITDPLVLRLDQLAAESAGTLTERSRSLATGIVVRIAVAGGAGLIAVIASIVISVRFGRRLASELAGLRSAALELADVRLPRLVKRLRRGEEVDVETDAPLIEVRGSAEVRDVARAFGSVRRTAIEAAVGQANLRRGVSQVFVNLARRKQSLLHRQLSLLDNMQRRATDPDNLDDLFALDHLTTRMRRHAEGLIILSGAEPGRAWRRPVPVIDAVRAAIAEVEDYKRVSVAPLPDVLLDGESVADITHLISELIENATLYSPPQTMVTVRGDLVANGFAVEVEDRGLGLGPVEYAEINARLADPPEFDLADSDRLGLFVVGRLAARHGIQVVLRASPFGGTTAIVLLPRAVIADTAASLSLTAERLAEQPSNGKRRMALAEPAPAALPPARRSGGLPRRTRTVPRAPAAQGAQPMAAPTLTVVADTPSGDATTIDTVTADTVTADTVTADAMTGDTVTGDTVTAGAEADRGAVVRETTGPGRLPRRVRQANLAPQLRQGTQTSRSPQDLHDSQGPQNSQDAETSQDVPAPAETASAGPTGPSEPSRPSESSPGAPESGAAAESGTAGRCPEQARALFSAFQAGTRRGRAEYENDFAQHNTGEKEDK
ncbi:nitrate- and nitrite sensing domain-containing protein [Planobispora rosea]|uniref:nitrate- and nitrite sensing domain-containing protein n=1 Tax=Planobispora rosea TaxID=35762 RepID=UPI00159EF829|nr:nitrate- and nitrite sensing domain-containing protein [Planobispora rosea]